MKMMARCAAGGPRLSTAEAWRAALVMLGVATLLMGTLMWARRAFVDSPIVDAVAAVAFPAAFLVTLPFLTKEGTSRRRQIITTAVALGILALSAALSIVI